MSKEQEEFNEEEAEFIAHTNYMFPWNECVTLIKGGEDNIEAQDIKLADALVLIKDGYTAIPF